MKKKRKSTWLNFLIRRIKGSLFPHVQADPHAPNKTIEEFADEMDDAYSEMQRRAYHDRERMNQGLAPRLYRGPTI